jgi:hypothetical protein
MCGFVPMKHRICTDRFSVLACWLLLVPARREYVIAIPQRYVAPDYQPPSFLFSTTESPDPSFTVSGEFGDSRRTG